jgi:ribosomal-protein-alanine N-acetyltransferase
MRKSDLSPPLRCALHTLHTLLEGEYHGLDSVPASQFTGFRFDALQRLGLVTISPDGISLTSAGKQAALQHPPPSQGFFMAGCFFPFSIPPAAHFHTLPHHALVLAEIETLNLRLRPFRLEDLDAYHAQIYSDPDVTRFLPGGQPRRKEQTEYILRYFIDHAQEHGFSVWAVEAKRAGQLIGHCGLAHLLGRSEIELVYAIGKAHWGQGLASEAAAAALRYGFETLRLERILALAYPENLPSQRVMQKIGMQYECVTERYYNAQLVLYSQTREAHQPSLTHYRVR